MVVDTQDPIPRDFFISKEDAEKHGYTRGCAGCSSWFRGLSRQPHSPECRERFRGILKDTAKYQNWLARKEEWEQAQKEKMDKKEEKVRMKIARYIEKQDRKDKKKREQEQAGIEAVEREEGEEEDDAEIVEINQVMAFVDDMAKDIAKVLVEEENE